MVFNHINEQKHTKVDITLVFSQKIIHMTCFFEPKKKKEKKQTKQTYDMITKGKLKLIF